MSSSQEYGKNENVSQTNAEYTNVFTYTGLANRISQDIDNRTKVTNVSTQITLYSSVDESTPAYTRNVNNWMVDYTEALTCLTAANGTSGTAEQKLCTAITKRHCVTAWHFKPSNGDTLYFVTEDNTIISRTVTDVDILSDKDGAIVLLDSDLPSAIVPCKIAPHEFNTLSATDYALISTDQERKLHCRDIGNFTNSGESVTFGTPTDPDRLALYEAIVLNDSSNPIWMAVEGELWLVSTYLTGGGGAGPYYGYYVADETLNNAIAQINSDNSVSGTYRVSVGNFNNLT
jgi:hypothetical protein